MKKTNLTYFIFVILMFASSLLSGEVLPLSQRFFHMQDRGVDYNRGTYLIVLADSSLESVLLEEETGNFIKFKQTQGYDVKVVDFDGVGGSAANLRYFLQNYHDNIDPLLEYVLLIGDVDGLYSIPSWGIDSYNEQETDVTDYTYTYRNGEDYLNSDFFIGRWSIRNQDDLRKIKFRTIQYTIMDYITDASYLNNALLVAGNFSDTPPWPVTPVMTSKWLMDELNHFGYSSIDTAFFHLDNQIIDNPLITSVWNDGVGVINYRGWGDANGWHKPYFHNDSVDELFNGLRLPVVFSFVCNTGDFGSSLPKCFGETLITGGSMSNPKGAVAMVGPSDLDTDTRFNNVMCAVMWDEMLEGRIPELAPALHAGKQSLIKEFNNLEVNGTNIAKFYHHVYGVLGDPSLSVWLGEPKSISHTNISYGRSDTSLFASTTILGDEIIDVVGALLHDGKLIAKGLSNEMGELIIVFPDVYAGFDMTLYLNKAQYFQEEIQLSVPTEPEEIAISYNYEIPTENSHYRYDVTNFDYEWKSLPDSHIVELSDDTINMKEIGFKFYYYGEEYESLTICSNGWVSFEPCLKHPDENNYQNCNQLAYFFNNSITSPLGPYGMLAPFFDDLDDNEGNEPFNVWYWSNEEDSLIIQWDDVANGQRDEDCVPGEPLSCPRHTFRLILDGNPDSCNEEGCNGDIIFAYESITDVDDHGSTVGIESPDKNAGIEYLFNYAYHEGALEELHDGLAIRFYQICDGKIYDNLCDCSGNVLDCTGVCGGMAIEDICGVCNGDGSSCKLGCTYYAAENYDPDATINDGSCYVLGCMDTNSYNYDPNATIDDETCCVDDDSLVEGTCAQVVDTYGCDHVLGEITIKEACPVTCDECSDLAIDNNPLPQTFYLNSFPNPFNPIVKVAFAIPEASLSVIDVFDIIGRKLDNLSNQFYSPGYYSVTWDASAYSTGVYFITLSSSEIRLTQKILLLK